MMDNDLLAALDEAMQHTSQAWAKLLYAPPADLPADLPGDARAIEAAINLLSDTMDALRPVRNRLRDEAQAGGTA